MKLIFLGTSAGRPTVARNVTAIALIFPEHQHRFWLFDAGEGTQHQLLRAKMKLNKLERIFITHLHGDHLYGLPGLLSSRTYFEGAGKLHVYGPPGLRAYLECVMLQSGAHLNYELEITEIEAGPIATGDEDFAVEADELVHRIRSFGYRIVERQRSGPLQLDLLAQRGIRPGPLYGRLKRGEDVVLENGETLRASEVVGPPAPGRIVAILGDTSPCEAAVRLAKDADLLVHEATFGTGMEEKAADYGHSTILQAAQAASLAKAKRLAVTHISARYDEQALAQQISEVRDVFPNIEAAFDFLELILPPH
ncbi:ribonuclease Z [Cohnella nanjingensis]|uniref:Ribonuclease Z n=1 Tax=Cohnella nanjingensis TaxID=1387779 RepID=A0A7X0VD19_9BACL|nr:ribonuclease Z [Cohnella nanjingensis]MBB6669532.1 ribonuclease Z [Cohnella nanjingensis]